MSALFKDLYSKKFYDFFAQACNEILSGFDQQKFITLIFCQQFDGYEFKQRE